MSIDFSQFKDGEEVAVTLVGTWRKDLSTSTGLYLHGLFYPSYLLSPQGAALTSAVDAYKIEPEHKKGDLFRYSYNNFLFVYEGDGYYRCLMFADGGVPSYKHPLSQKGNFNLGILTPVKVVEK